MVAFYKHDIADWMDGTESLSDGAYRAYHVICQLIYLNEGPVSNNERGIAGRCGQSLRAYRKHLAELIAAGKLRVENSRLTNSRAVSELENIETNRENARKGGKISAKRKTSGSNALKTNDVVQAPLQQDRSLIEKRREEETREEKKETRAVATATRPADRFEDFWKEYPRRKGANPKKPAQDGFARAVKAGADPGEIVAAAARFRTECEREGQIGTPYVAQAVTWLNQQRWQDYSAESAAANGTNAGVGGEALERSWFSKLDRAAREAVHDRLILQVAEKQCPPDILVKWRAQRSTDAPREIGGKQQSAGASSRNGPERKSPPAESENPAPPSIELALPLGRA